MKFAYADPPYFGKCGKFYDHVHGDGGCWDDWKTHGALIQALTTEYPDGWALSCASTNLAMLLPFCPTDVRIGAWVKPFAIYKKGVRPAYAWEPLIFRGGRNANHPPPVKGGKATTPKDFVSCNITLRKGLVGAKPEPFCHWVLALLNYRAGEDTLDDLFPGTNAMAKAVESWTTSSWNSITSLT